VSVRTGDANDTRSSQNEGYMQNVACWADRVKLLFWDGTGLVLATKRLEQGSFRWPSLREGVMRLTPGQLSALLEGLDWARVRGVRIPTPTAAS
jgi:transposase